MKKKGMLNPGGVATAILLCALMAGQAAAAKTVAVKDAHYNVNFSMADNLKGFVAKKVYIHLKSGQTLSGTLKAIGNHMVHLEKLDGKDFFDALIRLDEIGAIDARFREVQR